MSPEVLKSNLIMSNFIISILKLGKLRICMCYLAKLYHKGEFMRNGYYPGTCITNGCDESE